MSQVRTTSTDIETATLKAVRHLGQSGGFSLAGSLRYFSSKQLLKMADSEKYLPYYPVCPAFAQLNINNAVDKGLVKKLTNGKYKVNETARHRKSRSRSRSRAKPKDRSRSRKRSGSRRRKRSSSGGRRKRSRSGRRRKRSSSGRRRKRSSSGRRRKRSTSRRRRSRRRTKLPEEQE